MSNLPTVRDLMDTEFVTLTPDMSVGKAIGILMDKGMTGAVVIDEQKHVIGLLSENDCLETLLKGAYEQTPLGQVSEYMTSKVVAVSPHTDIFELTKLFMKHDFRRFAVVEGDKLVGQITRRDLLRALEDYWV